MLKEAWRRITSVFPSSHYVLLAALFFVGLELIVAFHRWIFAMAGILLALLVYGIVLVRLEERGRFHPTQVILPIMAAAGLTGFTLFLPITPLLHAYFTIAGLVFYWLLKHGAKQAYPTWNWTLSVIILFLDAAVILGLRFHLYLPLVATLFLLFAVFFLISLQALRRVSSSFVHALLLSASLAIILVELAWALLFLPVHYLIQAGMLVATYYVGFHLITLSFEGKLTRHHFIEYLLLGVGAAAMLLLTARWV